MRQIGTLDDEQSAHRFADYLVTQGITAHAEEDAGRWTIWVRDEDHLATAKAELEKFALDPHHEQFRGLTRAAQAIRREEESRRRAASKNVIEMRDQWATGLHRRMPFVMTLTVISVVLFVLTNLDQGNEAISDHLQICKNKHRAADGTFQDLLVDVKRGEVWRLITPMFLHGGPLHLIFNLMMLHSLGNQIEQRRGIGRFALLVLVLAVFSGLGQALVGHQQFVGMSGVVYGLFGYVWVKMLFEPSSGFYLSSSTVAASVVWFLICFSPGIANTIANGAHAGGLAAGMAIGYVPTLWKTRHM